PGYLALLVAVPASLARWPRPWRVATWAVAGLGLASVLAYGLAMSQPAWRAQQAGSKYYPYNFAGWGELAAAVGEELARMPPGTRVLADNFKIGAELGFVMEDPDIAVLDHPLNHKHGRAQQLRLWNLQRDDGRGAGPALLVVGAGEVKL